MSSVHVLFVTGEYPPMSGGIADYTRLLREALQPLGISSVVLSTSASDAEEATNSWNWRIWRQVRHIVREREIDIVHIQYQAGAFEMQAAVNVIPALIRGVPIVTTFHDLRPPYLFPKAGRIRYALMRRMARWSDIAIVTNPVDASTLQESGIRHREIPLGPSLPTPDTSGQPDNSVGFFGYPSRQKGFHMLLAAVGGIPQRNRPWITVVGGTPPESGAHGFLSRTDVENSARVHDVRIEWTGFLAPQEASNALAGCGLIAFPFPAGATLRSSALIAALQAGRPVITTEPQFQDGLGALRDLSQVVTVPTDDPEEFRREIGRAMDWTGPPDSLPVAHQWTSIAQQHRELYDTILKGRTV